MKPANQSAKVAPAVKSVSVVAPAAGVKSASTGTTKAVAAADQTATRFTPSTTRDDRTRRFGIDCPDDIVFREWSVGGEYIRKLLLKNTHDKLQVIHYRQPRQKATFFIDFPEPVTLSSGMSFELVIRFRPTMMQEITDSIPIFVEGRGEFEVGLVALTPYARLTVPDKYDFEFCPVKGVTHATVAVTNSGTIPVSVNWEIAAPFALEPRAFDLAIGASQQLKLTFAPSEAAALVARAVCKLASGEVLAAFPVSGIGKYVFLRLDGAPVVDFGSVLNGTQATRSFVVKNLSCVPAKFAIARQDADIVNPFTVTPTTGTIPRDGQQLFTVRFVPESTSAHYSNTFAVTCIGGNSLSVRCSAIVDGPRASLSVRSLDFGDVDLESLDGAKPFEKMIVLKNLCNIETAFNFVGCEPGQAFKIVPHCGVLGPGKLANIKVVFQPTAPINYLRRAYVIVRHGDEALYVDLLGTAFNSKMRPAPFSLKHVNCYHRRLTGGIGRLTPDDVNQLVEKMQEGSPAADEEEEAVRAVLGESLRELEDEEGGILSASAKAIASAKAKSHRAAGTKAVAGGKRTAALAHVLPADERYQLPFSLDEPQVVFRHGAAGEARVVTVRNHTSAKATACWSLASVSQPWTVSPPLADVPPFGSTTFEIRLGSAARSGTTFGEYLECYVYYKQMRSFRLVSEASFSPPQCLLLLCQSVTALTEASAPPAVSLPTHVAFPSCHKDDSVFQVAALVNTGETVMSYSVQVDSKRLKPTGRGTLRLPPGAHFDEDEPDAGDSDARGVFSCFPATGTIQPGATALVLCRFSPRAASKYSGTAVVSFNESHLGARQIFLRGEGFLPQMTLSGNGVLTFRPTAVGAKTVRKYKVENPSRIPIRYVITVPPKYAGLLSVEPSTGVLDACESIELTASFSPHSVRRYEIKLPVVVSAVKEPANGISPIVEQSLYVVGDGLIGIVAIEPLELKFDTVLVGTESSRQVTLFNSSLCDVAYRLQARLYKGEEAHAPQITFTPSSMGVLRARSHVAVDVNVTLPHRGTYDYYIYVVADASLETVEQIEPTVDDVQRLPHCALTVTGGHPLLEITDVRAVYQRKSHLWRHMSITNINAVLAMPVTHNDTETASYTFEGASQHLTPIVCELGVDVHRTAPTKVLLRLDNSGHCPVTFRFWLPHEGEVPKEPWHQDPVAGPQDLELAEVIDRRLFDISPCRGTIAPNEHIVLVVSYQHTKIGLHTLPVLLRIDKGKRILLHLTARTLKESDRYLAFHHTLSHQLMPVAIGDIDPPLQYTELQNLSHQVAEYHIDETALREVREKNYDFPVFQCLNPRGTIPAMSTLLLSWYFRPLEAKHYEMKVPIHVEGGDVYTVTVSGDGYHPSKTPKSELQRMNTANMAPLPMAPTLIHELLPLRLSLDVLRFSVVPVHSLHRQILYLTNSHPSDAFLFEWQSALQYGDQLLDVDPPRGRIAPGESLPLRVTLYTGSTSHVIDHPIHCHVLNDDLRQRRLEKRKEREAEAAMQLEAGPAADPNAATSYSLTGGSQMKDAARESRRGAEAPRQRSAVTTIPPKFQNTNRLRQAIQQLTEAAAAEDLNENDPLLVDVDVLPTVLEVLVQTRIVQLDHFYDVYGRDLGATSLYHPTFNSFSAEVPDDSKDRAPNSEELDVATDVIEEVLLHLVRSRHIQDAYCDISDDPVPFFCQMRTINDPELELQPTEGADDDVAAGGAASASDDVPDGDLQCLVEEVLEDVLFDIITQGQAPTGVLTRAAHMAARAKTTSQIGSRSAAAAASANRAGAVRGAPNDNGASVLPPQVAAGLKSGRPKGGAPAGSVTFK